MVKIWLTIFGTSGGLIDFRCGEVREKAVTHLFALLFFAAVLGSVIAMLWTIFDEDRALIAANMPWKSNSERPRAIVRSVSRNGVAYWATPSITSVTPTRARTVSPAITR